VDETDVNFVNPYKYDNRLVVACKAPTDGEDKESDGIKPPDGVPEERIGFSDLVADRDNVARRHLLNLTLPSTSKSECLVNEAFNVRLAFNYLAEQGKTKSFENGNLQIDNVIFKRLKQHSSGYQDVDANGYQILLNYRSLASVDQIAEKVSLREILEEEVPLERIKERIVLIGRISPTDLGIKDAWKTPFTPIAKSYNKQVPGVFVQAQMVSQIISAVLDSRRPLLWWWSLGIEILWVWGWSLVGGIVALCFSKPWQLGAAVSIIFFTIFAICFSIFLIAGWVPLIPCLLSFAATQLAIVLWLKRSYLNKKMIIKL